MKFSELMATLRLDEGRGKVGLSADWMQGRSAFGGLQAALLVRAMRNCVRDAPPLRTLQVSFVAPVPADRDIRIEARLLRRGRSAIQVEARLILDDATLCLAVGIFGAARDSVVTLAPTSSPMVTDDGPELPWKAGLVPNFIQHFSMRWLQGGLPFTGALRPVSSIALHHRDPSPTTEAHLVALADAVPPAVLSILNAPANGSSLTWTLEFLRDDLEGLPRTGWRMDLEMTAARDGYTQQSGLMWAPDGQAVALSRQTTVVFA